MDEQHSEQSLENMLPAHIKSELSSLLTLIEKNLNLTCVYDYGPEIAFLKRIEELKREYDYGFLESYILRYEQLRDEREKLQRIWLKE
ncbi:MAG: hypothetical protein QXK80_01185 [Candidatus Pacearchaeota archaeon]